MGGASNFRKWKCNHLWTLYNLLLRSRPGQHLPTLSKRFARDLEGLVLKVSTQIPNNVENIKIYQSFFMLYLFERTLRKLHMTFTFISTIERNCINFLSCSVRLKMHRLCLIVSLFSFFGWQHCFGLVKATVWWTFDQLFLTIQNHVSNWTMYSNLNITWLLIIHV